MAIEFNRRIKEVVGSSTLAITARAKELKAQGCDVVNFAAGEPDFDTPETIKKAAIQAIENGQTKYTPSIGMLPLREAIAQKFQKDNQLTYTPKQIAVSCGAKHSLFCIIQVLADEGDEVIIPAPHWVSYPEMVKLAGATPKYIQTTAENHFRLTADQLSEAITDRTKILILNSPSNPTGSLYTRQELEAIADICVKNNVYVISDEIYEKLIYTDTAYTSIASLGKEIYDLTVTVNGVSKAYAMTGWRIGYSAGAEEIMANIKKIQDHSTSCPSSVSQAAALAALQEPEEKIAEMCAEFKKRRDTMMTCLDAVNQVDYIKPDGAFYMFCDFSQLGASLDVAKRIINDVNVAIIPGEGFHAPGFMRLSFATSLERIQEGTRRIAEWVQKNHSQ
jgi:aspartate aminotransferase